MELDELILWNIPWPIRAPSQSYRRGFGAYMRYILPLSCNLVSTYPIEPVPRGTIVTGSTHTAAISSPVGPVPRGTIVSSGNQRLSTRAEGTIRRKDRKKAVSIRQVCVVLLKE